MKLGNVIKLTLGVLVIGLILYKVGFEKITSTITRMNISYIPLFIILFTIGLYMGAWNMKILLDAMGAKLKMNDVWRAYLLSWAFGMVVPGKVGEFSFIYLVKDKMKVGEATAVAVIDKMITALSLCMLAFIGFFIFFPFKTAVLLTIGVSSASIIGLIFLLTQFGRKIMKKILGRKHEIFSGFSKTMKYLIFEEKKAVIVNIVVTFLKWGVTAVLTWSVFKSFGANVNPLVIISVSATAMLISLIPITMSGLGIKEGASVFLYGLAGVGGAVTISVQLILLVLNYVGAAIVFFFVKK
jgi:glycosyltransferase 2 family protein